MKVKNYILALFAMASLAGAPQAAAQKESLKSRTVSVGTFSGINAAVFTVNYSVGAQKAIKIDAPANLIDEVEVVVKNNRLYVKPKKENHRLRNTDKVVVTVSAPAVNSFSASAGADINIKTEINTGSKPLNLNASSGADIKLSTGRGALINADASSGADIHAVFLNAPSVNLTTSSAGEIKVNRLLSTKALNTNASSGSEIKVSAVKCQSVINTDASSGADIKIEDIETGTINAGASSGGSIVLEGKTAKLNRSTSSGGSIKTRNLEY